MMYAHHPAPPPRSSRSPSIPAWLIVASILCCFPIGLVLLWMRSDWPVNMRVWLSAVIGGGGALLIIAGALAPQPQTTPAAAVSPAPTASPTVTRTVTATPTSSPSPTRSRDTPSPDVPKTTRPAVPHTHHSKPSPSVRHTHAVSTCGAPANPYRLNFCGRGHLVTSPPSGTCTYFDCIPAFDDGTGYLVQCDDGMYSMSGGRPGTCSHHGGEGRPVRQG